MRDVAIKKICRRLAEEYKTDISDFTALDFFARAGDWQTKYYAEKVRKVYAWEVDPDFEVQLRSNLPKSAEVTIGDSFALSREREGLFDMVVLDNPQGCYGPDNKYCEHFEALPLALKCLKVGGGIIIFNVKVQPFNYQNKLLWKSKRNSFYSREDCSRLDENFVFQFYESYMRDRGYSVDFSFWERRPQEPGLYAMTMGVCK